MSPHVHDPRATAPSPQLGKEGLDILEQLHQVQEWCLGPLGLQ